jgi:AcrR family transcriptional regulator
MPRLVDHEERRARVAAAVWSVVSAEGLEAVTVRRVAAETGMSTSVVSHYFRARARAEAEARATGGGGRARALLVTALPLDAARRTEARIWFSFLGLALVRPELAAEQRGAYRAWRAALADALRAEGLHPGLDAEAEAAALIALVDGLAVQAAFEPRRLPGTRQVALLDERLTGLGVH